MKSNSLLAILVGALCVCGLVTLWLSVRYYFSVKELHKVHSYMLTLAQTRNAAQSLAREAIVYSRGNPSILPLLSRYNLSAPADATNSTAATTESQPQP